MDGSKAEGRLSTHLEFTTSAEARCGEGTGRQNPSQFVSAVAIRTGSSLTDQSRLAAWGDEFEPTT